MPRTAWAVVNSAPLKPFVREQVAWGRADFQQVPGDVALADDRRDDGPGADDAAAQVGLHGEAEAVEPLGVGGVAAEPGGQAVAGAGPLVRAADLGRVLHRQCAGVHLLAVIFRQPGRENGPELLERSSQPASPAVGLVLATAAPGTGGPSRR